ncbi:DUF5686 family protein [Algoriphagus taiwanensis]|uniref:DUF5686 family protein n=1 Tax=Algoriphagus taiwanensis TaxID=1445656 RepID=A0ABQ6Q3M4_9BACT|nr:DUF5686 family protein [Algoriphagus taiwanensis]
MQTITSKVAFFQVLTFFWLINVSFAQSGRQSFQVFDQATGQPIPFVHIKVENKEGTGTTSDVRGTFSISGFQEGDVLIFSHVGYQRQEVTFSRLKRNPMVYLVQETQELETFEFSAGENPALALVRKAIANRDINNPEKLKSFRYASYNKMVVTLDGLTENPEVDDSLVNFLEGGHLFMSETYSEVKFKSPGKRNENVQASKISGIENPIFAAVSTSFQPFSVYSDHIKILEIPFVNPISEDGMRKYDYFLEDSLQTDWGKTYLISYQPKSGKSYRLGKGLLYISSRLYALENFLLKPAEEVGQINFEIQQKNRFDGEHWFPEQMNSIYVFSELDFESKKVKLVNQTFLSDIRINDLDPKEKISPIGVTFDLAKGEKDWAQLRMDSLSTREFLTYQRFDNLDPKIKRRLNSGANFLAYLSTGRVRLGAVDVLPNRIFRFNQYERFGLGLGLSSSQSLSDLFRLEGYFRYGFQDKAWKYGGSLGFLLDSEQDIRFQLGYSQDIEEPGRTLLPRGRSFTTSGLVYRNFLLSRVDEVQRYFVSYSQMPLKGFRYKLIGSVENRVNVLDFAESSPPDEYVSRFTATEAGVELNYVGGESTTRVGNDIVSMTLSYPVIGFRLSKSIPDLLGGNVNFLSSEFKFEHQWSAGNSLHQLHMTAQGIWGSDLPVSYLNTGYGIQVQAGEGFDLPLVFPGFLQTMQVYEFLSDRSLHVNYAHLTGPIFTKKGKGVSIAPQLKFHQSFAIGSLSNPDRYDFIRFQTMERGYWESGLEIANLIKLNSGLNSQGWGIGFFYRYGPYALPDSRDNLRFTLSLTAAF